MIQSIGSVLGWVVCKALSLPVEVYGEGAKLLKAGLTSIGIPCGD